MAISKSISVINAAIPIWHLQANEFSISKRINKVLRNPIIRVISDKIAPISIPINVPTEEFWTGAIFLFCPVVGKWRVANK